VGHGRDFDPLLPARQHDLKGRLIAAANVLLSGWAFEHFELGCCEGKDLVYMGKVGTGWSRTVSSQIRKQLDAVVSPKSKLTKPIKKPTATWVEPTFVADIEYRDITSEGLLRASSFKGLSRK
jgi:ATP-dependent DNA ligase